MLGRLTKFEFKATARVFLPMYIALVTVTLVNKLSLVLQGSFDPGSVMGKIMGVVTGLMIFLFVMTVIAMFFATLFIILQRYYKNLFTDEGYLMHTLPVKPGAHIASKLITSSVWLVASVIIVLLSIFILFIDHDLAVMIREFFAALPETMARLQETYGVNCYALIAACAGFAVIAVPSMIMMFYFAITLGSIILPKHKIGGAFIAYIAIDMVMQTIMVIVLLAGGFLLTNNLDELLASSFPPSNILYFLLAMQSLLYIAIGTAGFAVSSSIFRKKLNLE